jgi:hypothetical protein
MDMKHTLLGVNPLIDPALETREHKIYWRCATDSIWEGPAGCNAVVD